MQLFEAWGGADEATVEGLEELHELLARAVVVPLAVPLDDLEQLRRRLAALAHRVQRGEATAQLLEIVKRDRKWNDDGARKQLVQLFEAFDGGFVRPAPGLEELHRAACARRSSPTCRPA